jgi:PAS domain S-box-containing protein
VAWFPPRSIRIKLAVLILSLAGLPLAAAGIGGVLGAQAYLRRQAHLTLVEELTHLNEQVLTLVSALGADVRLARALVLEAHGEGPRLQSTLRTFVLARPSYGSAFLLDADGRLVAHAEHRPWRARESLLYASVAQSIPPGGSAVLPVELLSSDSGQFVRPSLAVVAPVALGDSGPRGALVLELDADTLIGIFRRASSSLGGTLAVVAGDGRLLFHSVRHRLGHSLLEASPEGALSTDFAPEQIHQLLGEPGEFVAGSRFVLHRPVGLVGMRPEDRLAAYREVSRAALFAPARRLGRLILLGLVLTLAVALALAVAAARHFTRPILQRRDAARAVAEGRGDAAPPEVHTHDEIEDLARDFVTMTRDVRERRERLERLVADLESSERALRESEHSYQVLVDSVDGIVWEADARTFQFSFVSKQAERLLGYPTERWVAEPTFWQDHIHPDDRDEAVSYCMSATREGRSHEFEYRMTASDGRALWLTDRVEVITENGVPARLRGLMVDITARKKVEDALRRSEASYRSLVETSPYGIFRAALDGRLLAVNQALVSMLGYESEAELLAAGATSDVAWRGRNGASNLELEWKRRDGRTISVRLTGRVIRSERDEAECFEGVAEDVTERRTLETQLRQAQKMEAVGQLAGGMAHDFNNLLTTILATTELISGELPPESPLGGDLKAIQGESRRGAELVRKLLAFSRRQRLTLQAVDVGKLVGEFVAVLRRMVREDIEIKTVLDDGTMVQADPGAIEQILTNLVTNARDAMSGGGTLLIQVGRSTLDADYCASRAWAAPGEFVALSVSDTGVGMDEATQRRVFEPFFTTKPVGSGTGLGLAMVYGLVKQHDGYVHLYSEPGLGTAVRVYLPALLGTAEPQAAASAVARARGGTETILVAEDEDSLRRAAKRVLEKHGYQVLVARDGIEALEVYRANADRIALIISDVVMPRLGGPQMLEQLRQGGSSVKVLFSSGYTARDIAESQRLDPSLPFLPKPWAIGDLLRRVRETLDQ